MKILYLSDDFSPESFGGAGRVAETLAQGMVKAGHEVAVIYRTASPERSQQVVRNGMKIYPLYISYNVRWRYYLSLYNPQVVSKVDAIMAEFMPDVVHAHNLHYYLSFACLARARKYTSRIFLTAHDVMLFHYDKLSEIYRVITPEGIEEVRYKPLLRRQVMRFRLRYNPFRNVIIKHYLKSVTSIFAVSDALRHALTAHGIRNVITVHNGIDTAAWQERAEETQSFKKRFNLDGRKVILFAGRISGMKGGEIMLQALQEIVQRVPTALLLIAGQRDAYAESLIAKARRAGIEANIRITEWLSGPDLIAAYHSSSVVVVPSQYLDPFPTVILEAMACAKPVVCTNLGGSEEIVVNEKTGFVIDPFKVSDIVDRVFYILTHKDKASTLGASGYERVTKNFSLQLHITAILSNYTKT